MKIKLVFEVDDHDRRAIAHDQGDTGRANRETVALWMETVIEAALETLRADLDETEDEDN